MHHQRPGYARFLAATVAILLSACHPPSAPEWDPDLPPDARPQYGLRGDVRGFREIQYDLPDSSAFEAVPDSLPPAMVTEVRFNPEGRIAMYAVWKDGVLQSRVRNTYDSTGLLREAVGEGEVFARMACTYDDAGRRLEQQLFNADGGMTEKQTWRYDGDGRLVERRQRLLRRAATGEREETRIRETYRYVETDTRIRREFRDDRLVSEVYRAGGKVRKTLRYAPDGSLSTRSVYQYDTAGRLIRETHYLPDGVPDLQHERTYDAGGNLVRKRVFRHRQMLVSLELYRYDSLGNPLHGRNWFSWFDGEGREHPADTTQAPNETNGYRYVYGADGNWQRKEWTRNGLPFRLMIREIE